MERLFVGVAILTAGARVIFAMTLDASSHRRDVRNLAHDVHVCDLSVTHIARHFYF
jgi:predicted kinase